MIQITRRAALYLEQLRSVRGFSQRAAARLVDRNGRVGLTFAERPERGDQLVPRRGLDIYLEPRVANRLDGSLIDARTKDGRTWLVTRPVGSSAARAAGAEGS